MKKKIRTSVHYNQHDHVNDDENLWIKYIKSNYYYRPALKNLVYIKKGTLKNAIYHSKYILTVKLIYRNFLVIKLRIESFYLELFMGHTFKQTNHKLNIHNHNHIIILTIVDFFKKSIKPFFKLFHIWNIFYKKTITNSKIYN